MDGIITFANPAWEQIPGYNTGIGISEEDVSTICTPFKQISDGYAREHEGMGLGLPLARLLVELLDGNLSIESEPGHGTEVTIQFPL